MGQRAAFFIVKDNGTVLKTTTQWSTVPDATFGHFIAHARKDGIDPKDALRILMENITKYGHVSAVEIDDKIENPFNEQRDELGYSVRVIRGSGQPDMGLKAFEVDAELKAETDLGSVGVVFDEKQPDLVSFRWFDNDGEFIDSPVSATALADFYEELETENKLMPINNRRPHLTMLTS